MRVSKAKVAEHHGSILQAASRLFRARGIDAVGVAEIMQASGLTHGAFYGHFRSKAELAGAACREAFAQSLAKWQRAPSLSVIFDRYLSCAHRDTPGEGCALSALGAEIARHDTHIQQDFAAGLKACIAQVEARLEESDPAARRAKAIATVSAMVGAVSLARAVKEADAPLSDEILASVRAALRETAGA
ncbi:TetR/AcrR family transcriptional regulator [Ancylobacter sp. SL191]|uniref:TetR/AcrR family transcriptional regulator n=1 Tax=Ancylobacter sp. SL191 TaxID=2995166 RepID=UPI0022714053|nr:TetR family transcriptional regulator [Ancylobacter sp. SL191]WAC28808.1 TetR family transcriptional regulator [Ancylobacter sp. SL191]